MHLVTQRNLTISELLFISQHAKNRLRTISKEAAGKTTTTEKSQIEDHPIDGNKCAATEGTEETEIDESEA